MDIQDLIAKLSSMLEVSKQDALSVLNSGDLDSAYLLELASLRKQIELLVCDLEALD
ncbi:hypothetical protein [Vibrio cortegadensis]|uniref:Uncharacterized protein n=1 Tax=Vibrio cortegadensis TaxID=1328770 RepID=A0ABV4M7Y9_9VIBR